MTTEGDGKNDPKQPSRKMDRRSCRVAMRCRQVKGVGLYESKETYINGWVRNTSPTGLLLESPIFFAAGNKLEVAFKSPDDKQSFLCIVAVKWVKRVGEYFHLGVEFEKLDKL